ncbi:HV03 protein, partial [Piaya cayana]|nr:HV03 protein [Piaya cayana]
QPRVMEAGGGLKAPGDSVLLSCHSFGLPFKNSAVRRYRQAAGARLEWVSIISASSSVIRFRPSVQGRATISRDNSQSVAFLSLRALHLRDSACYFCTVYTERGNVAELEQK